MPILVHFDKKMQEASFNWFLNILLAILLFLNAEAGRLLGIQGLPLAISAVWPPTGFSLAAILLFGFKTWPGIFVGNFCYNYYHLVFDQNISIAPVLAAIGISLGSLFQAVVGGHIMRRYTSPGYFNTVRDVCIFLIPAGLLSCLIASSIGVLALYLLGNLTWHSISYTWLTFWLGDTLGVYVFTPLLVIWSMRRADVALARYQREIIFMALGFVVVSVLSFLHGYPLAYLFTPLSIWVAYRYRMHGVTLINILIVLVSILATTMGYGVFTALVRNPILVLVSFLEATIATSLIVAAVVNEREAAWRLMQNHDVDVFQAVQMHTEGFKETDIQQFVQQKIATLGVLTAAIARQIQQSLKKIGHFSKISKEGLFKLQNALGKQKEKLEIEVIRMNENVLENLGNAIHSIAKVGANGHKIAKMIEEQIARTAAARVTVKSVDINTLLSKSLLQATGEAARRYPEFTFTVIEEFDRGIRPIFALPDDLSRAFKLLLNNAIFAMKEKKDVLGASYMPVLELHTLNQEKAIEIVLRDNGPGISEDRLKHFFQSFISTEYAEEVTSLGLALAHDLIVHLHQGKVRVDSKEGEFLQITITLPKP